MLLAPTIRRAIPADAARLAELAARTFRQAFGAQNRPEDLDLHLRTRYGPAQQEAELRDPTISSFLVELDGEAIGYAQLRDGPAPPCIDRQGAVELMRFYVDEAWKGRGIAQALMEAVTAEARVRNAERLWLGVWEKNPRAIAFYGKCGFVDVGWQPFTVGTDPQRDRVLELRL
jgi:ribosomal protein S18 acetylase RimI-like enzyme